MSIRIEEIEREIEALNIAKKALVHELYNETMKTLNGKFLPLFSDIDILYAGLRCNNNVRIELRASKENMDFIFSQDGFTQTEEGRIEFWKHPDGRFVSPEYTERFNFLTGRMAILMGFYK